MEIEAAVPALRAIKNVVVDAYTTQQELFFQLENHWPLDILTGMVDE